MKALAGLAGLTLAASALAGCGGSSSAPHATAVSSASSTTAKAVATPVASNADVGNSPTQIKADKKAAVHGSTSSIAGAGSSSSGTSSSGTSHATDRVTRGHHVQHAKSTASSNDDQSSTGTVGVNPCRLVTAPEARSITAGGIVGITEAPLGPTCIYHSTKAKSPNITMTVETMKLAQVTQRLSGKAQFSIKDHPAYCGKLGTQMLFVPLANGQVLNVVAPCSVAREFASVALGRLAA
jgi:hypothetical protein